MKNHHLLFKKIENLRQQIEAKGKLSLEILRKIDYHFDWNVTIRRIGWKEIRSQNRKLGA
jgi:hypothetical protein